MPATILLYAVRGLDATRVNEELHLGSRQGRPPDHPHPRGRVPGPCLTTSDVQRALGRPEGTLHPLERNIVLIFLKHRFH